MVNQIAIGDLNFDDYGLMVDVRSPSEFNHAHIPNAINLPLFSDEQRAIVGTAYKQVSREEAIKIGLDYFGPQMRFMVEKIENIIANKESKKILVHCWRGGMRSGAVSWLLDMYGFEVSLLIGGYKAYRNYVLDTLNKDYNLKIIAGYTGSRKTQYLHQLSRDGKSVIDLEALANHKGSAFGHLGQDNEQPSQELFENKIASILHRFKNANIIYIEDECRRMGHVYIPDGLWGNMKKASLLSLEITFEERLKNILDEYGNYPPDQLKEGVMRIAKRLGGLETKNCLASIDNGDINEAFSILIKYYDRSYDKAKENANLT